MKGKNKYIYRRIAVGVALFGLGVIFGFNIKAVASQTELVKDLIVHEFKLPEIEEYGPKIESLGLFTLTAYCPCSLCCGKSDGITASGTIATEGRTIAADTSILPFGTEVYINGQAYVVEDRGGAVKGNKLDIFFNDHEEALQFGVKRDVEVFRVIES